MKHRNLFFFALALVLAALAVACVPQAEPVTKPAGTIEERVLSFEYSDEPAFPLDFSGDLNSNALVSGAAVLTDHGVVQANNLTTIVAQNASLYIRAVAGVDSKGCLVLGDDAGTKMIKGAARMAGASLNVCFGQAFGEYLLRSNAQAAWISVRGDRATLYVDGHEVLSVSIDGAEYVYDRVADSGLVNDEITAIVDFAVGARDTFGADYVDILAYSPRFLYAHPAGEQEYSYAVEETVEIGEWVAITLADGTETTTLRMASQPEVRTAEYDSEERITVAWPAIDVQTLDAAQQAAAASAASDCFITVGSGEGPYNTTARVAEANGLTTQQLVTLRGELMDYYNGPEQWAAGIQVSVTCPSEVTGMTGTELGVAPAGN